MNIKRKLKILSGSALIGATGAYLFDPTHGRSRRERLASKIESRSADVRHAKKTIKRVADAVQPGDRVNPEPAIGGDSRASATANGSTGGKAGLVSVA